MYADSAYESKQAKTFYRHSNKKPFKWSAQAIFN